MLYQCKPLSVSHSVPVDVLQCMFNQIAAVTILNACCISASLCLSHTVFLLMSYNVCLTRLLLLPFWMRAVSVQASVCLTQCSCWCPTSSVWSECCCYVLSACCIRASLCLNQSTHKGVNQRSKYVTQVQQQRLESPAVTLTWHACKYKVHKLHQRYPTVTLTWHACKYKVHKLHQRYPTVTLTWHACKYKVQKLH